MQDCSVDHGLPSDPHIAGLGEALAPACFALHMGEALGRAGIAVDRCRLERFRYRQGERLVVVYHVDARDLRTTNALPLLVSGRIHANVRAGRTSHGFRAGADISCRMWLPQLAMRVEVFPEDRRIPALRRYAVPEIAMRSGLFSAWRGAAPASGEGSDRSSLEIEPVRYRPGIAATLRWRASGGTLADGESDCFVKLEAGGLGMDRIDLIRSIEAACRRAGVRLSLSAPLVRNETDCAALYPSARGRSLHAILVSPLPLSQCLERTARALACLHRLELQGTPAPAPARMIGKLERAARFIDWACVEHAPLVEHVLRRAREVLELPVAGLSHGDMKADHIFLSLDDERVEMIDSDALALGNPLMDIGSLLARIRAMPWLDDIPAARAHGASEQLREAYQDQVPREWRSLLPAAEAANTLLVCQHAIQRLEPGWRALVAAELEHAALAA